MTSAMRPSSVSCLPLCHSIVNELGSGHCHNQSEGSRPPPTCGEMLTAVGVSPLFFYIFFVCPCVVFSIQFEWKPAAFAPDHNGTVRQWHCWCSRYNFITSQHRALPLAHASLPRPPPLKALNPPHNPQPSIASPRASVRGRCWTGGSSRWH